jgi:hypothetical protein
MVDREQRNKIWKEQLNSRFLTNINIQATTQTQTILNDIFPKCIATMIDNYFRPVTSSMLDIIWSGYYELCVSALSISEIKEETWKIINEAIKPGQLEIFKLVEPYERFRSDSLYAAILHGRCDIVAYLLDKYQSQDYANKAIEIATKTNNFEIATLIMKHGADAMIGLRAACKKGNIEMAKLMFAQSEPSIQGWNDFETRMSVVFPADAGLTMACAHGHDNIIRLMIELGATKLNQGLYCACEHGHMSAIRIMIEAGATYCRSCKKSLEDHVKDGFTKIWNRWAST